MGKEHSEAECVAAWRESLERFLALLNQWQPRPAEVAVAAIVLARYTMLGGVGLNQAETILSMFIRDTGLVPYAGPRPTGGGVNFSLVPFRELAERVVNESEPGDAARQVIELALNGMSDARSRTGN